MSPHPSDKSAITSRNLRHLPPSLNTASGDNLLQSSKNAVRKIFSHKGKDDSDSDESISVTQGSPVVSKFHLPFSPEKEDPGDPIQDGVSVETNGNRERRLELSSLPPPKSESPKVDSVIRPATIPNTQVDSQIQFGHVQGDKVQDIRLKSGKVQSSEVQSSKVQEIKVKNSKVRSSEANGKEAQGKAQRSELHAGPEKSRRNIHKPKVHRARRRSRSVCGVRASSRRRNYRLCRSIDLNRGPPPIVPNVSATTRPISVKHVGTGVERKSSVLSVGDLASALRDEDGVGLEHRLATVEVKLVDLEMAIGRIQNSKKKSSSSGEKPKRRPATAKQSASRSAGRKGTVLTSENLGHAVDEHHHDKQLPPLPLRPRSIASKGKSSISKSSIGRNPIPAEQHSALVLLFRKELYARQNLEQEIVALRKEIRQLRGGANVGARWPMHGMALESLSSGSPVSDEETFADFRPILDGSSRLYLHSNALEPRNSQTIDVGGMT